MMKTAITHRLCSDFENIKNHWLIVMEKYEGGRTPPSLTQLPEPFYE
jgi:hypothetical protein